MFLSKKCYKIVKEKNQKLLLIMKKLTSNVLAVVLSSSFVVGNAQEKQKDSVKVKEIGEVVITALGIKRENKSLDPQSGDYHFADFLDFHRVFLFFLCVSDHKGRRKNNC